MNLKVSLFAFFTFTVLFPHTINAQSFDGITGIRDTSFTVVSAYKNDVKKHPNIKIVKEFDFKTVKELRDITYCSWGERELKLDIFKNETSSSLKTAIIFIHGGAWRTGDKSQHHPLAQQLANRGYVCFTPEYRLSTEALFPSAIYDLKAAIRWVRANADTYNIDPEKIVVSGFSAGGELASFIGTTANKAIFENEGCFSEVSSHVNAIINIDGILSFIHPDSGGEENENISAATHWFGYNKKENPLLWKLASPLTHVNSQTPPSLFINSSVSHMHAGRKDFIDVLRNYNIYSEIISFETAPHSFILYHPWFEPSVNGIDNFLQLVFQY